MRETIDAVKAMMDKSGKGEIASFYNAILERVIDKLIALPSAQPEQRWMPVDLQNNSPEENKAVLLGVRFRDDFRYFVTSRQDYNLGYWIGREIKGELRWQPLPEPWRAEGRTDEGD